MATKKLFWREIENLIFEARSLLPDAKMNVFTWGYEILIVFEMPGETLEFRHSFDSTKDWAL
jgi:hypothetical protein